MSCLAPFSFIYGKLVSLRHFCYQKQWLRVHFAPLPVVSVGNLVCGGSGKTQVVLALAQALESRLKIALVSRGYKGQAERGKAPFVVHPIKQSAEQCGDEPLLLARRCPKSLVIVHQNRLRSCIVAKKLGYELAILDDGMQHRRLYRDFEIVVLDGNSKLNSEKFLPVGQLREDPRRLGEADLIVYMGEPSDLLKAQVATLTDAPHVVAKVQVKQIASLDGKPIPSIEGTPVGLFCGIGNPQRFVATVEGLGAQVRETCFAPDHGRLSPKALQKFAERSKKKGARYLVCTEKDQVKFSSHETKSALPIYWLKTELEITSHKEVWQSTINKLLTWASVKVTQKSPSFKETGVAV